MSDHLASVQRVLETEAAALHGLASTIADQAESVAAVCDHLLATTGDGRPGRLVTTGVGKAGLVARKVAATFASTGTPGFHLHPTDALHGDLGMIQADDTVLAFSNSGASEELLAVIPALRHIGCWVVAITGRRESDLARLADHYLDLGALAEACPLGLAPSTTTTAMIALGDALALAVLEARRFTPEQYARFHPGGSLGRQLMTCSEAMRTGDRVASVGPETTVLEAMHAIGRARVGSAILVDEAGRLSGILTDGDLRRILSEAHDPGAVLAATVADHATIPCQSIASSDLLEAALRTCAERHINELPVIDAERRVVGLIDIQDLVARGFDVRRETSARQESGAAHDIGSGV